jgi:hypothetical protein
MTGNIPDMQLIALIFSPRIFVMIETLMCSFTVKDVAVNTVSFKGQTSLLLNLFLLPTWCTIPLFCNICIILNTSTCIEQYYAHLQQVKIAFYRIWYRHALHCTARPLTESGPEGSRKLRFPDFMTTVQDGGKVVSLTHRPPLPPGNTPGTHFC